MMLMECLAITLAITCGAVPMFMKFCGNDPASPTRPTRPRDPLACHEAGPPGR
jgi:hypothetical protein